MSLDLNFDVQKHYRVPIFYFGKVISLNDPNNTGQIKVFLSGIDVSENDPNIPIALPLLPKHLNVYPKVGERVTVMVQYSVVGNQATNSATRYWIGPWISQPQKLEFEDFTQSQSDKPDGIIKLDGSLNNNSLSKGIYPEKEYIAIQGRDNSDLIFKNKEVLLRAGKFIPSKPKEFNKKDSAYIQIRYLTKNEDNVTPDNENMGSNINIVSNYINLLSHNGNTSGKFVLSDQKDMITNKDQSYINKNTHPVPFGDVLVNFLKLVQNYAAQHVHPYNGMSPDPNDSLLKLINFDLSSILNNYVRTN